MERKLYVTSKEFHDGVRLIGILSEKNGRYKFEYKLGGIVREWFLVLPEFPVVDRVYDGPDVQKFIDRFVPRKDHRYLKQIMESANLTEYDAWEMLKAFGPRKAGRDDAFVHETLPEGTIIYEPLD